MRRSFVRWLLIAPCWIMGSAQGHAEKHWIQTYIDAYGGCRNQLPTIITTTPFGKPASDWSDDDLNNLKVVLSNCTKTRIGEKTDEFFIDGIKKETASLLQSTTEYIQTARADREKQEAQLAARKEIAQSRMSTANERTGRSKAAAEADVRQLEAQAARAEAEARLTTERREQARRSAQDRIARAEAETRRPNNRTEPSEQLSENQGFPFSENELMRRFTTGSAKAFVLPNLRNETENAEVRTHVYEVGRKNLLYTMEYKANQHVRDFSILLAAGDQENAAIGLLLFGTALDTVSPGLTSSDRSSIIDQMLKIVVQDDGIYEKNMEAYTLKCMKTGGLFCAFTPK